MRLFSLLFLDVSLYCPSNQSFTIGETQLQLIKKTVWLPTATTPTVLVLAAPPSASVAQPLPLPYLGRCPCGPRSAAELRSVSASLSHPHGVPVGWVQTQLQERGRQRALGSAGCVAAAVLAGSVRLAGSGRGGPWARLSQGRGCGAHSPVDTPDPSGP